MSLKNTKRPLTRDITVETIKSNWKAIIRFKLKIDKSIPYGPNGECWKWVGASSGNYGTAWLDGQVYLAHRIAYVLFKGKNLKANIEVMHKCDYGLCCNPKHLTRGTQLDNMRDASAKGRMKWKSSHIFRLDKKYLQSTRARGSKHGSKLHPESRPRGSKVNTAKLGELAVLKIRKLAKTMLHKDIALRYNVSKHIIDRIVARETWKWLNP